MARASMDLRDTLIAFQTWRHDHPDVVSLPVGSVADQFISDWSKVVEQGYMPLIGEGDSDQVPIAEALAALKDIANDEGQPPGDRIAAATIIVQYAQWAQDE